MPRKARSLDRLPPVFTSAEAYALGAAPLRSRNQGLIRDSQGIWRSAPALEQADPAELFLRRARAVLAKTPHSWLTHEAAAFLYGMPLPAPGPPQIHLARALRANLSSRPGVVTWRTCLSEEDQRIHEPTGLPITSMRQTLLLLAQTWSCEDLVAAIDWMIRTPRPLLEGRREPHDRVDRISSWLASKGRRRGAPALRRALALARVGSDSPMETKLRLALAERGLPEPECNPHIPVWRSGGGSAYVQPDLAYPEWKVAVEYQGAGHASHEAMKRDITKKAQLEHAGWLVVQIHSGHMRHRWADAVALVRRALASRGG